MLGLAETRGWILSTWVDFKRQWIFLGDPRSYKLYEMYCPVIYSDVCYVDYCIDCGFFDDSANRGEKEGQKRRGAIKANAHANDAERKTRLKLQILRFDGFPLQ